MISPPWCGAMRSEEHTSELQSQSNLVCRLLLEKKNKLEPARHCRSLSSPIRGGGLSNDSTRRGPCRTGPYPVGRPRCLAACSIQYLSYGPASTVSTATTSPMLACLSYV